MWRRLLARLPAGRRANLTGPIGLEFAAEKLHLMQMEHHAEGSAIIAAASVAYPGERDDLLADPARLKSFLRAALRSKPFRGRSVVSCLPAEDVRIMVINYRPEGGKKPDEAILKAVRERLGELPDALVDFVLIRSPAEDAEEHSALVAITTQTCVTSYLDRLAQAGLTTAALDVRPVALSRLVTSVQPEGGPYANVLLVNFGASRSYLSVISGRRLMLDREVEMGETQLVARLARTLGMPEAAALRLLQTAGSPPVDGGTRPETPLDDDDARRTLGEVLHPALTALGQEINKTMVYMAGKTRGDSIERIYLLGSVARYPHAASWVQDLFSQPVEVLNPFAAFAARSDAAVLKDLDPIAGIAVATGLALWRPAQG